MFSNVAALLLKARVPLTLLFLAAAAVLALFVQRPHADPGGAAVTAAPSPARTPRAVSRSQAVSLAPSALPEQRLLTVIYLVESSLSAAIIAALEENNQTPAERGAAYRTYEVLVVWTPEEEALLRRRLAEIAAEQGAQALVTVIDLRRR